MDFFKKNADRIKQEAANLGFISCGISKAGFLEEEAPRLESWLRNGHHGSMKYMENHFEKRLDPTKLVDGAKSVISLLYNYYPDQDLSDCGGYKVSKYAYGEDYHFVIKDKLKLLMQFIEENIGEVSGRAFVDSAPVLDRVWAQRSGLGWIGKHSLLLSKQKGSFFFIAELIVDLELQEDHPVTDHCGSCTACIDSCPTEAIIKPYVVDSNKCISHATIELKDAIPDYLKGKMDDWIFGCDVCQDVCPWNRFSKPHNEPRFEPKPEFKELLSNDFIELTDVVFQKVFNKSAVKRTKFLGLSRNISFVQEK